ncbi:MAG: hypothetical protein GC160_25370 [Acidobacteria bacterium]|nr:hypothetical protein [Acidobacteriota bacterium]
MVTLPNQGLRRRIERLERRLPPLLDRPEVTIRVFGNEEGGGYTISSINYGTHVETFAFDLTPSEYAEFMAPVEGEESFPEDDPEPLRRPPSTPEPTPQPHIPTNRRQSPTNPDRIDPVLAHHLRQPQNAPLLPLHNAPPPARDFLSPSRNSPGYGVVAEPRLSFSSPKAKNNRLS